VITDAEVYALSPGGHRVQPGPHPAMADIAVLDERRGVLLDLFGRTRATSDGGSTWQDLTPVFGLAPTGLGVSERAIWVQAGQGEFELTGEPLGPPTSVAQSRNGFKPGEIRNPTIRRVLDVHPRWGGSGEPLLVSAVRGGIALPDGTALGMSSQRVGRVDLETGETLEEYADPLHNGLTCQPLSVDDGVLFACRWEQYQYYGGYVLWSEHGERPSVEKAFSDDGMFIATDDGALAYTGACQATPRYVEGGRFHGGDEPLSSTICVRRGRGVWAERKLPDVFTDRWIPSVDGTAVAIVRNRDDSLNGLVPRVDTPPPMSVRGVRIVDMPTLGDGYELVSVDSSQQAALEQDFTVRSDGTWAGWVTRSRDEGDVHVGLEVAPSGRVTLLEPPPNVENTVVTGRWGLARSREGKMFETRDRGRTWTSVEDSPVAANAFNGSCSKLGCVLSSFVRVGWGAADVDVRLAPKPDVEPADQGRGGRVPLRCVPRGSPSIAPQVIGELAAQVSARRGTSMATGYGGTVRVVQLASDETEPNPQPGESSPKKESPSAVDTHAIVWTPPFDVDAPPRALGAVLPDDSRRNPATIPLLDESGRVALLVMRETEELVLRAESVDVWPAYTEGRGFWRRLAATGGLLNEGHADVVLMVNQLPALERHGPRPSLLPRFFGLPREVMQGRALAVAAVPRGGRALLMLNRPGPDPVAVAAIRPHGDLEPAKGLAAWRDALPMGDARCPAEASGYRAVLVIDPAAWFFLEPSDMPGVRLGHQGLVLVHWGEKRVCVEAMRLSVAVDRHGTDVAAIVGRFGGHRGVGAALRSPQIVQPLQCELGGIREP